MSKTTLDGFTLWNIDVPRASNPLSAIFRSKRTAFSVPQPVKPQIVIPPSLQNAQHPGPYVILVDNRASVNGYVPENAVYNIACTKDRELSESIRLLLRIKSKSFQGQLKSLFSFKSTFVGFDMVSGDASGNLYHSSLRRRRFVYSYKYRPGWTAGARFIDPRIWLHFSPSFLEYIIGPPASMPAEATMLLNMVPRCTHALTRSTLVEHLQDRDLMVLLVSECLDRTRIYEVVCLVVCLALFTHCLLPFVSSLVPAIIILSSQILISLLTRPLLSQKGNKITTDEWYRALLRSVGLSSGIAGRFCSRLICDCGVSVVTDRETTVVERRMIWTICQLIDSEFENRTAAKQPTDGSDSISGAKTKNIETTASTQPVGKQIQMRSLSKMGTGLTDGNFEGMNDISTENQNSVSAAMRHKFLILCTPSANHRCIVQIQLLGGPEEQGDTKIISKLKTTYFRNRPFWSRLTSLSGVSAIRITRFELAHNMVSPLPLKLEWKWPSKENFDWEWDEDDVDASVDSIADMAMHLWQTDCTSKPLAKSKPNRSLIPEIRIRFKDREEILTDVFPTPARSLPWLRRAISVKIHFPERESQDASPLSEGEFDASLSWLKTATLEITTEATPRYIYNRTPKKLHKKMDIDTSGIRPPIGWAIWVDEDFIVPWYLPVIFLIIALGSFIFAIAYTATQGPKVNGWTISTGILSIVNFVFTAWVLRTKDSKHGRR